VVDILAAAAQAGAALPPPAPAAAAAAAAAEAAASAAAATESGAALLEELLPAIADPTVVHGLKDNAVKMLGVTAVGTAATYISTSQLDVVGAKISNDLRKKLFGNVLDQGG